MQKILTIGFIVLLFSWISCINKKTEPGTETIDCRSLTVEQLDNSTIFKDIQYVLLKYSKDFGQVRQIDRIKIYGNKLYVSDNRNKVLVVYDLQGNPIAEIGHRGRAAGEFLDVADFDIDEQGFVHVVDANADKLIIYKSDYKYFKTIDLPFEVNILKCLSEDKYLLELSSWNKGKIKDYQVVICDSRLNIESVEKYYDRNNIDDNVWLSSFSFITLGDEIFFHRTIDDNVHIFSNAGKYLKKYFFDFGSSSVPYKYRRDIEHVRVEIGNYQFLLNFNVITANHVYGTIFDGGVEKDYIIDRESNRIYTKARWENDLTGNFITISDNKLIGELMDVELYSKVFSVNVDSVSHILSMIPIMNNSNITNSDIAGL